MTEISLVIATRNRPELLYRYLKALLKQTSALGRFEVIVVDVGPSEATRRTVQHVAMRGQGRMTLRYCESRPDRARCRPPWLYLLIVTCAALAGMLALAGVHLAAALFGVAALLGILGIALQRLRGASLAPAHVAEMLVTSFVIPFAALYWRLVGSVRFRVLFP